SASARAAAVAPALVITTRVPASCAAPKLTEVELPDIKGAVDRAVRWMRSTQDAKTGAYGDGVASTAWCVLALSTSPRHYVRSDGPFIARALDYLNEHAREDGAICDVNATESARIEQTKIAALALSGSVDASNREVLAGALGFLGRNGVDDPTAVTLNQRAQSIEEAEKRSNRLLAQRDEHGAWKGDEGALLATARTIVELSSYYTRWKAKSTPGMAKPLPVYDEVDAVAIQAAIGKGALFLVKTSQGGSWGAPGEPDAGLTAMVLAALAVVPEPRPAGIQAELEAGWAWLAAMQHEDGSIHDGKLASYITSASILALTRSGKDEYADCIKRAQQFLVGLQSDEGEGYSSDHHYYGGIGYGGDERPDLSNLQMALEALAASGLDSDHEAYGRALTFLQRCQNRSETNDLELVEDGATLVSGEDGGAAYMPGNSPAGYVELADGRKVPRSYGSMSYALLKGYIFSGLERDDPRVQALWKWLQDHYTLDINPGFEFSSDRTAAYQGLFYYFHTMAKALDLFGEDTIVDKAGVRHLWRKELSGRLLAMQSKVDGSWINQNSPRWWEGNPLLATAYVLLTLDCAKP
ncbi:MAG: squalene-hopene/tetraprenyl-beta-curcumene cyclase, partial [Planctomycetota bacterium]